MTPDILALREPYLPADAESYRALGPFTLETIPKGLWREHNLKEGVWAVLSVQQGQIRFCWDDEQGGAHLLGQGMRFLIPPTIPHHLEQMEPVIISLTFWTVSTKTVPTKKDVMGQ